MNISRWVISLAAVLLLTSFSLWHPFGQRVDFNKQVKPILNKNCIVCHGGVKKASGYSLLFSHEALAPAKSGRLAIVPGDADASELIRRISLPDSDDERMPLDHPHLSPADIQTLRHWIDEGAEWGNHWAYQSPKKPDVPTIGSIWGRLGLAKDRELGWVRNEIDHFVLARLKTADAPGVASLQPAPEADPATLLRRVSLDLTGLPPTQAEQTDFLRDKAPNRYEKAVDRLLASPGYGERWAGMWLDLARYADTKGYERDPGRKIWRYRDYLIRAFNQDKPYDQFLTEQLAGDLLPGKLRTDETLTATGFHRNTMTNDEGGTQDEEFRTAAVMDRVSTTWDVFQGTTFACVQCHSHPYDPFVHEDYYRYLAFFNNTRDEDVTTETPTLRFYAGPDSTRLVQLKTYLNRALPAVQRADAEQFVRIMEPKYNSHALEAVTNASLLDAKFFGLQHGGIGRLRGVTQPKQSRLLIAVGCGVAGSMVQLRQDAATGPLLATIPVPNTGSEWADTVLSHPLADSQSQSGKHDLYVTVSNPAKPKKWVMLKWLAFRPALPDPAMDRQFVALLNARPETTPVLWEGTGELARPTHVFQRGNWTVKGAQVQPGTPKSLPPMAPDASGRPMPKNRLGLARWMTQPDHPLTARVAVNRLWEQLFGMGIVETVEDFGTQGIQPTHRELLDWLAVTFQTEDHWSLKKTLKRIVLSAAYRQRSSASPAQIGIDPTNKWLARGPRVRLTAEQVRDQALSVSGLLSHRMYGPSVMPPQPDGVWQSPYNGDAWVTATGENRYRRALYTYWKRTAPYPSMTTFDSPSREFCQVRRLRTDTPLQALVTLNDPVYVEAARHLAVFMAQQGQSASAQLQAGFRRVTGHELTPRQLAVLLRLYRQTEQTYRQHPADAQKLLATAQPNASAALAALTVTANTMLNLDTVITKE